MLKHTAPALMLALLATGALAAGGPAAGGSECAACHEAAVTAFAGSTHDRLRPHETGDGVTGCASCHGDTAKHVESGDPADIMRFGKDPAADSAVCLACHATRGMAEWNASVHAGEAGCTTCHAIHAASNPAGACAACHADVNAVAMHSPSRHPLREGKMTCASCHDPHVANPGALKTAERKNDLCLSCHPAQEGPFIFEHAPVEEDCSICHQPHGAVANNLLVANEPYLCLQCHEFHFHTGFKAEDGTTVTIGGKTYNNVMGYDGNQRAFATKCTQCHVKVHGSDLPSQTVTGRGQGLLR